MILVIIKMETLRAITCTECIKNKNYKNFVYMLNDRLFRLEHCHKCHTKPNFTQKWCHRCHIKKEYDDFLCRNKWGISDFCFDCRKIRRMEAKLNKLA